jgi:hypothetical protein
MSLDRIHLGGILLIYDLRNARQSDIGLRLSREALSDRFQTEMRRTFEVAVRSLVRSRKRRGEGMSRETEVCERGDEVDVERSNWSVAVPFAGDKQVNVSPTVAARREG